MGRETKLLLGLLATLLGVFMGVLSMKLLVPRPPEGAGPDVHADVAAAETQDLVDPPQFAAGDELPVAQASPAATAAQGVTAADLVSSAELTPSQSRFAPRTVPDAPLPNRDPFVAPASLTQPADDMPPAQPDRPAEMSPPQPTSDSFPARFEPAPPRASEPPPLADSPTYVTRPGDSWWSLAERSYGDGRLYRALFAWNRAVDPRISLVPGTSIEIPPAERLQAAWPGLHPAH
jgi:nucleoid-associated protein YgaU